MANTYKMDFGSISSEADSPLMSQSAPSIRIPEKDEEAGYVTKGAEGQASSPDRASWGGRLEFLMTCIGFAVGLGNVWRFPYLAYKNGGGAFLVPFILMLALVGLPLFFLDLAFGQFASLGPLAIWRINPLFKGLGYCMVWISWFIGLYYNVVISHVMFYLVASLTSELPWQHCGHDWNTPTCGQLVFLEGDYLSRSFNSSNATLTQVNISMCCVDSVPRALPNVTANESVGALFSAVSKTSSEEYYQNYVLELSGGIDDMGGINWKLCLSLLFCWSLVAVVLIRGISSMGKVVYFTALFPYVMLFILLIRGVTLEGAGTGLLYYLTPRFSELANARVWSDAATQIFYSLSTCSGGLIAMSSFNKFHNNCYRDALIVAILDIGTAVFAGLVIFSVLGFMANEKGVSVDKVVAGGPGLAFIVYPEALARMPVAPLWSVFFFIMMATLGFGSEFSIIECVLTAFTDEFPTILRPKRNSYIFRVASCALMFLLGLPMVTKGGMYLLNIVDGSISMFPLLLVGLFEFIAISYIYGYERFASDIEMMIGHKPNIYWKACWLVVSPLVLLLTTVSVSVQYENPTYADKAYPDWAISLGWCIALFPILWIPGWFIVYFCRFGGWDIMRINMMPLATWGPAEPDHRASSHYERVPTDDNMSQIAWNPAYKPSDYITSIASHLGSKRTVSESECSATESQTNLNIGPLSKSEKDSSL